MAERLTERERHRARALILRGRATPPKSDEEKAARQEKHQEERELIERFFREFESWDLARCIGQFEVSEEAAHRKECAQLLIAYFVWVKNCHCGAVPVAADEPIRWDGIGDMEQYILEFVRVAFERMTGLRIDPSEGFDLPRWESPNAGFGWAHPSHRSKRDTFHRDLGILCFIELQRRQGRTPLAAARRARWEFSSNPSKPLGLDTLQDIVRDYAFLVWADPVRGFGEWIPLPYLDEELQENVDLALAWVAERRRGKAP
jgi:hypothetical protein